MLPSSGRRHTLVYALSRPISTSLRLLLASFASNFCFVEFQLTGQQLRHCRSSGVSLALGALLYPRARRRSYRYESQRIIKKTPIEHSGSWANIARGGAVEVKNEEEPQHCSGAEHCLCGLTNERNEGLMRQK